jgi:GNAT superfamily N-acetyltransferase
MEAVRPVTEADLGELVRLGEGARDAIAASRGGAMYLLCDAREPPLAAVFREAMHDPEQHVVLGTVDHAAVGYMLARLVALRDGTTMAVIDELYVEPAGREIGVGEGLVESALAWANEQGCRGIQARALPGDRGTKNLFERFGLVARAITVYRSLLRDPDLSDPD